jgi:EpsD family peptidyl-prolyl cis-trans isomerase
MQTLLSFSRRPALSRLGRMACGAAAVLLLAACGAKADKAATQVAAKVNKDEISVHQVNFMLQRQGTVAPGQEQAVSQEAVERLIDQQLALQKAEELKIDRDPQVMQAVDAARREIVARAYLERMGSSISKPTAQEIRQYYAAKPLLFAQRRIYDLREVNIEAAPEQIQQLQSKLATARNADELATQLRAAGLRHEVRQSSTAPESLPMAVVDRVASLGPGQSLVLTAPGGAKVVYLVEARPAPLDEAAAAPRIERFLLNERKRQVFEQDLKALRAKAQIEYVGAFAQAPADTASSPAAN